MNRPALLFIGVLVMIIMWTPSIWATDPASLPLKFFEFNQADMEDTQQLSKLKALVVNEFKEDQDGYIQLSKTEFIIFVSNTGRIGLGLYLVDLATNTISESPFAPGYAKIISTLKDKSGNDYLLLHHSYPMHGGYGGGAYSLLSARKSGRGKAIIALMELGNSKSVSEEIGDECAGEDNAGRIINTDIDVSLVDMNIDGYSDITVIFQQINCRNKKRAKSEITYFASPYGFKSIDTKDPRRTVAKLLRAQKKAIDERRVAAEILEKAGVRQFLYEKPLGMSSSAYASLLNDFVFYTGPYSWREAWQGIDILDSVIQLSPRRAVAYLNRAEFLYQMLSHGEIKTQQEKIDAAREIIKDYSTYRALSGKTLDQWENFTAFNLASYSAKIDVCEYIEKYYKAGQINSWPRIEEIHLETRRLDINNDGLIEDVEFEPGKYGYKTYSGFTIKDARGKQAKFTGTVSQKPDTGYGFQIFSFEGKVYKELPMLDISSIDHDKEELICESEWSEPKNGIRELKSMRKVE